MSTSSLTLKPICSSIDQKTINFYFDVTIGAGDYVTGGLACSFGGLVTAAGAPLFVEFESQESPTTGYVYHFNRGASTSPPVTAGITTGKFQIFTGAAAQSALTELSAGATPAGVTGDSIVMKVSFLRESL